MLIPIVSLFLAMVSGQISIQPIEHYQFQISGNDISSEYHAEWDELSDDRTETLISELRHYKILMVPGFFSNNLIAFGQLPGADKLRWGEQFEDYMNWYEAHDIQHERVYIESEASPDYNAKIIRDSIKNSELPVILIAQSKGCMDSLVTLLTYPEVQEKIVAFLPLNGPFQGTPLADAALSLKYLHFTIDWILERMGGSIQSVESLRVEDSKKYISEHAEEIQKIISNKPLVSFAARIKRDPKRWNTNFAYPRNYLQDHGYINDGLLPWQSSILPGSEYILVDGIDHATSIRYSKPIPFDRVHFMQTMLWILRKRMPEKKF